MLTTAILLPLSVTGCGKTGRNSDKKTVQKGEDDFLDNDAKPDERKYLLARNRSLPPSPIENMRTLTRCCPDTR